MRGRSDRYLQRRRCHGHRHLYHLRSSTDSAGNPIDFKPENTLDEDTATTWRCTGDGSR
ncbi:MAG: hypothetical protein R2715_05595 [Ilumatobacteraceae bacterium]